MNEHDKHLDDIWADPDKLQVEIQCQVCEDVFWKNICNKCRTCEHYGKWGNYYNICPAFFDKNTFKLIKWSSSIPKHMSKLPFVFWIDKGVFK